MEDGIPYAIDFLNPAPDADIHSVGQANFDWIVNAVAEMAVAKALSDENPVKELRWASFLAGGSSAAASQSEGHEKESKSLVPFFANFAAFLCALCGQDL